MGHAFKKAFLSSGFDKLFFWSHSFKKPACLKQAFSGSARKSSGPQLGTKPFTKAASSFIREPVPVSGFTEKLADPRSSSKEI